MQWNNVTAEWHTPKVENDLQKGGRFLFEMGLRDGSFHFNFEGIYDNIEINKSIRYTLNDGRTAEILFSGSSPVIIT